MPDQEQLDDFLEALEKTGSPAKNPALRLALGWEEPLYEGVKAELVAKGIVVRGRGRSDSVSLVGAEPLAQQAATSTNARKAKASGNGTPKDNSLESWIWDAACSIRAVNARNDDASAAVLDRMSQATSAPQFLPMGAEKLLLLPAEWPDQIRPFNAPAAQGLPCRLVLPDQLAA